MNGYKKFRSGKYRIILRDDFKDKLKPLFSDPHGFIKKHIKKTYMEFPNLVAEIYLESGEKLLVKSFGWRSRFHFLISPFRISKAMRSFNVAKRLIESGITTPTPVCVIVRRYFCFVVENIYITESIEDYITVREYLQKQPDGYAKSHLLLSGLADYVKKLHDAGVWHRDLHLTNFLMKKNKSHHPVFYLVDLNRARSFYKLPFILRVFDIGKMDLHEFRADFIDFYLRGVKRKVFWERIFYIYVILRRIRKRVLKPT